jgi:hypothetical protein
VEEAREKVAFNVETFDREVREVSESTKFDEWRRKTRETRARRKVGFNVVKPAMSEGREDGYRCL